MKSIIVFYSYGGNTRKIAEMIQKKTGADMLEIETEKAYSGTYDDVVNQGQEEVNSGYMPKLKPFNRDFSEYDTVYLGTPVWWYTFAPAVKTLLNEKLFDGKTIIPFATNGGWIGHTFKDIKSACPNSEVKDGINIRFDGVHLVDDEQKILNRI